MIRTLLLAIALFLTLGVQAAKAGSDIWIMGGDKPYPWGTETVFPWNEIEGCWQNDRLKDAFFEFKIIRETSAGTKYLKVRLLSNREEILAEGVAVARKKDRIVRARVQGEEGDFFMLVRSYIGKDKITGRWKEETFLTVRPLDNDPKKDVHYLIYKISGCN